MSIMKKLLYFLPLLFTCNLFSQVKIFPFRKLEFKNFTPKWIHVTSDSSLINISKNLDGFNHLALVRVSEEPLSFINDNYLYNVLVSAFDGGINGSLIEKIDIQSGERIWMNHFDLRTTDRIEQPVKAFLTQDNQLEIVNFRVTEEVDPIIYSIGGGRVQTSIRKIDISNGMEHSHIYSPVIDSTLHIISENYRLPNPIKKIDSNAYVHTYFSYGFFNEQIGLPLDRYYYISILMDSLGETKDTLYRIDPSIPFRQNATVIFGGIRHINSDTSIMLMGSYIPGSAKKSLISSLMMVDNNGKILRRFNLNDEILPYITSTTNVYYGIAYSDDDFIVIVSKIDNERHFFIFDLKKTSMVNSFSLSDSSEKSIEYISPKLLRLKGSSFLVAATKYDFNDNPRKYKLEFLKCSQNEDIQIIKSFSFKEGEALVPLYLYQLENSDIVLSGTHSIDSTFVVNDITKTRPFGNWLNTVYFSKEEINLNTSIENIETKFDFKVFPNPAMNKLNLQLDEALTGTVHIYNNLGEKMLLKALKNKKHMSIDVSNFSKGIYFVNLISEHGQIYSKSFVKEK
ncbi:MAG TPA: T9SS type A sorting domain-containing protein [Bacteroidetes bacterium]|nr:T9SS type A sorting domain-containing protein [Bacteroidota bacterium]